MHIAFLSLIAYRIFIDINSPLLPLWISLGFLGLLSFPAYAWIKKQKQRLVLKNQSLKVYDLFFSSFPTTIPAGTQLTLTLEYFETSGESGTSKESTPTINLTYDINSVLIIKKRIILAPLICTADKIKVFEKIHSFLKSNGFAVLAHNEFDNSTKQKMKPER
jgi:hypothetical protein